MMPSRSKIRDVAEIAEMEFWRAVAEELPQAKSGDLDPIRAMNFSDQCIQIVKDWAEANIHD